MDRSSSSSSSSASSCSSDGGGGMGFFFSSLAKQTRRRRRNQRRVFCDSGDSQQEAAVSADSIPIEADLARALEHLLPPIGGGGGGIPAIGNALQSLVSANTSISKLIVATSEEDASIATATSGRQCELDRDHRHRHLHCPSLLPILLDGNARLLDTCRTVLDSIDAHRDYVASLRRALEPYTSDASAATRISTRITATARARNSLAAAVQSRARRFQKPSQPRGGLSKACRSMLRDLGKKKLESVAKPGDDCQLLPPTSICSGGVDASLYASTAVSMVVLELVAACLIIAPSGSPKLLVSRRIPHVSSLQALWAPPLSALLRASSSSAASMPAISMTKKKTTMQNSSSLLPELDLVDSSAVRFLHLLQLQREEDEEELAGSWQDVCRLACSMSAFQHEVLDSLDLVRCQIQALFSSLLDIRMQLL